MKSFNGRTFFFFILHSLDDVHKIDIITEFYKILIYFPKFKIVQHSYNKKK